MRKLIKKGQAVEKAINELEKKVTQFGNLASSSTSSLTGGNNNGHGNSGGNSCKREILEYKCIQNLKELGDEKAGSKAWSDKMKNAFNQARPGARAILKYLEDNHREDDVLIFNIEKLKSQSCVSVYNINIDAFTEDLYGFLMDKLEGEPLAKAKRVFPVPATPCSETSLISGFSRA